MYSKENIFIDTIVSFRNYRDGSGAKRIICNADISDKNLDKMIWECNYISGWLEYQKKHNKFSFISFKRAGKYLISSFYECDKKNKKTFERMRFKIENKKIIGINILPCIVEEFIPIDEYDNPNLDGVIY
ncbi:MAG: hypothetical protein WC209_16740 [Ignavibacteriaceae bacterium]|jgi:hypothetical protein